MPGKPRIAVDNMVTTPVNEWDRIARNYNWLITALEGLADAIEREDLPEVIEARAAIKEAREI